MKIAIGLFGFLRITSESLCERFLNFYNKISSITALDIYIYFPETVNEFSDELVDIEYIKMELYKLKEELKIDVNINIYSFVYEPYKFIHYSMKFKFNFKNKLNLYPHRLLSLHYNISELSKCILHSKKDYDFVVLTRCDMLSEIINLGDINRFKEKNSIFIWRDTNNCIIAEDRIIVSSILGLEKLSFLYDDYEKLSIIEDDHCSEKILGMQLNLYNDLIKKDQNIHMNFVPNKDLKYSKEFDIRCEELFNRYNIDFLPMQILH